MKYLRLMPSLGLALVAAGAAWAQPPVPSTWQGEASGRIHGVAFRVPVTIEFSVPIEYEKNPFHLSVATGSVQAVGDVLLVSATSVTTGAAPMSWTKKGPVGVYTQRTTPHGAFRPTPGSGVTLQYLAVTSEGPAITAELTETNASAAAAINGFAGPNVSALEASPLMREVMESMGKTEMFIFRKGASIKMRLEGGLLRGTMDGIGSSVTNTSSGVAYACRFEAKRVK